MLAGAGSSCPIQEELIALTFLLTLKDARRFRKSWDVACYLGLSAGTQELGPGRTADAHPRKAK